MGLETLSEFDKARCAIVSRIVKLHNTHTRTPHLFKIVCSTYNSNSQKLNLHFKICKCAYNYQI